MSQSKSVLLVCPACKSRRQVPRELIGHRVRCRQCTAELIVELPEQEEDDLLLEDEPISSSSIAMAATSSSQATASIDDLSLPPIADPSSNVPPAPRQDEDYRVGPPPVPPPKIDTATGKPPSPAPPPDTWVKPPERKTLGWSFTSGIFTYFLRPTAATQWIVLSALLIIGLWLLLLGYQYLSGGWLAVAGGCFAFAGLIGIFVALCYGSACFVAIVENTAYHLDKADRWPESDFVEWVVRFLHMLYLVAVTSLLTAPLVAVSALADPALAPWVAALAFHVLFPVMLLSVLETNSPLWPISPPILRSLIDDWHAWLVFYAVSAVLWIAWNIAIVISIRYIPISPALLIGPLTAAVVFSYARLIGRLASYIMHLEEKDKPKGL